MINKGQRVKIKDRSTMGNSYKVGDIGVVECYENDRFVYLEMYDGESQVVSEWQLELIPAEEPKYLTKAEALKAAIDGQLVTPTDKTENYLSWDDKANHFVFNTPDGEKEKAYSFLEFDEWKIYEPPAPFIPKFSIGQFFTNEPDDYGRIIEITKDGYMVTFNGSRTKLKYTEDKMMEVE